ncbi:hypothetical protein L1987_44109 [Smallanthus sonchifolius]|uniref:Uncharacterized protein n=1 Tax=Smallanthus sonchifolius TaxID=185202 RepID=A0ACB9GP67_9ASTR|nr:hypothetical protein L1987_44109 [Smallanthus sonchifolius]
MASSSRKRSSKPGSNRGKQLKVPDSKPTSRSAQFSLVGARFGDGEPIGADGSVEGACFGGGANSAVKGALFGGGAAVGAYASMDGLASLPLDVGRIDLREQKKILRGRLNTLEQLFDIFHRSLKALLKA